MILLGHCVDVHVVVVDLGHFLYVSLRGNVRLLNRSPILIGNACRRLFDSSSAAGGEAVCPGVGWSGTAGVGR